MIFSIERVLRRMTFKNEVEVRREFQHVNPNKATGPDNIAPWVLKACAEQLAYIFCIILCVFLHKYCSILFNACFSKTVYLENCMHCAYTETTCHIVHVAFTSAVIKVCKRMVLCKLEKLVKDYLDPLVC